jgi:hypothetical protein
MLENKVSSSYPSFVETIFSFALSRGIPQPDKTGHAGASVRRILFIFVDHDLRRWGCHRQNVRAYVMTGDRKYLVEKGIHSLPGRQKTSGVAR